MMEPRKETELGELPASWRVAQLGELLSKAQYGASVKGASSGAYPILRMTNQVNGRISSANLQYADVSSRDLENFRVQRGDILFNRTNSFELVGRTAIFDLVGDYVFASYLIRLRTLEAVLNPFFLNAYLNARETQRRLKGIATRAVSQSNISASRLRTFVVPVPPIAEQRKIVMVLGLVQEAMDQQERLIALSSELKKALLHHLFTHGLRGEPQKQTEIGPVPHSWEAVALGDVISQSPKNGLYKHNSAYGSGTLILRINDFSNDGDKVFTAALRVELDAGETKLYALREDDIVTNRVNSLSHLGKTALIGRLEEPMVFESNMMRFRVDENRAIPAYVLRLLNSPVGKNQFLGSAKRAVGQASISQGNLRAIKVPLPSVSMQRKIVNILDTVIQKNEIHQRKHTALTALFRILLHRLMTAELRVHDLELPGREIMP